MCDWDSSALWLWFDVSLAVFFLDSYFIFSIKNRPSALNIFVRWAKCWRDRCGSVYLNFFILWFHAKSKTFHIRQYCRTAAWHRCRSPLPPKYEKLSKINMNISWMKLLFSHELSTFCHVCDKIDSVRCWNVLILGNLRNFQLDFHGNDVTDQFAL